MISRVGSRANVAIKEDGRWAHYGSNGMGYSLDAWLALGPGPVLAMFGGGAWPAWEPGEWQWESWALAGALVDVDARELLLFLECGYDERLGALEAYPRVWPGWTVRWAWNGMSDITDALGLDRAVVRREPWTETDLFRWGRPEKDPTAEPWMYQLITVGDVAYGPAPDRAWEIGPSVLGQIPELRQVAVWPKVPRAGLHLDPDTRSAGIWSIEPVHGLTERFAERWPGWTLDFWEDRFAEQEARCGGAFRFPVPDVDQAVRRLVGRMLDHALVTNEMFSDRWPAPEEEYDPYYGLRDARLTIDDIQGIADRLLGPGREPVDVAARAAKMRR